MSKEELLDDLLDIADELQAMTDRIELRGWDLRPYQASPGIWIAMHDALEGARKVQSHIRRAHNALQSVSQQEMYLPGNINREDGR